MISFLVRCFVTAAFVKAHRRQRFDGRCNNEPPLPSRRREQGGIVRILLAHVKRNVLLHVSEPDARLRIFMLRTSYIELCDGRSWTIVEIAPKAAIRTWLLFCSRLHSSHALNTHFCWRRTTSSTTSSALLTSRLMKQKPASSTTLFESTDRRRTATVTRALEMRRRSVRSLQHLC